MQKCTGSGSMIATLAGLRLSVTVLSSAATPIVTRPRVTGTASASGRVRLPVSRAGYVSPAATDSDSESPLPVLRT